jgi:histone acetyltransferase (RNA polymerase elongator complex component)
MDDEVLLKSHRGHTAADTVKASELIRSHGIRLGLQIMTGLPGDTMEKTVMTAHEIIRLKANEARIYPVVVIRGTTLETYYNQGKYQPLSLGEAVVRTKEAVMILDKAGVTILRIGLHPSEGILTGHDLVAGPFHPSFRELVVTEIWNDLFSGLREETKGVKLKISVNPLDLNAAVGYYSKNKKQLEGKYRTVKFLSDPSITRQTFHADYC